MSAVQLLLEDALLAAAPLGLRRPVLVEAAGLRALLGQRIKAGTAVAAFAVDLLGRMSGQPDRPPAAPASLVEALTEREQVVLGYLASTLSNAEICLSVNTVKTHQRMVYRKLGCRRSTRRRPTSQTARGPLTGVPLATAHPTGMTRTHPGRRDRFYRHQDAQTRGRRPGCRQFGSPDRGTRTFRSFVPRRDCTTSTNVSHRGLSVMSLVPRAKIAVPWSAPQIPDC